MALLKPARRAKQVIDLNGPQGNAYYLLGTADVMARQLGLDADAIDKEMTAGNYRTLVETFDKYFGELVDIILPFNWSTYE